MKSSTSAPKAQSRLCGARTRRASYATMRKEVAAIAHRHFSDAFNEIVRYAARVNPNGYSYVDQYLRAMRDQLEWHEAAPTVQADARRVTA